MAPVRFYHYLELHHSQTTDLIFQDHMWFYHYLELHHSQTMKITVDDLSEVLPLSGITSLSNQIAK